MNYILGLPDQSAEETNKMSLQNLFYEDLQKFFRKVFKEEEIKQMNSITENRENLKEKTMILEEGETKEEAKYREKVEKYTSFKINRKIEKNTELYSSS